MTIKQFIEAVPKEEWTADGGYTGRLLRRADGCCPVVALCRTRVENIEEGYFSAAVRVIGMRYCDAELIVCAADAWRRVSAVKWRKIQASRRVLINRLCESAT